MTRTRRLILAGLVCSLGLLIVPVSAIAVSRQARLLAREVGGTAVAAGHLVVYASDTRTVAVYYTRSRRTRRFAVPCTPTAMHGAIVLVLCAQGLHERPAFQGVPYVLDARNGVLRQVPVHDQGYIEFGGRFWDIGSVWIAGTGCDAGTGKCGPTYVNWHTGEVSTVYDEEFDIRRNLNDPKLRLRGNAEMSPITETGPFTIFEMEHGLVARRERRSHQVCRNPPRGCMAPRAAYGVLAWSATEQPMAYARNLRTGRLASWVFPEGVTRYPGVPVPVQPIDGQVVFAVRTTANNDQATTELWIASTKALAASRRRP